MRARGRGQHTKRRIDSDVAMARAAAMSTHHCRLPACSPRRCCRRPQPPLLTLVLYERGHLSSCLAADTIQHLHLFPCPSCTTSMCTPPLVSPLPPSNTASVRTRSRRAHHLCPLSYKTSAVLRRLVLPCLVSLPPPPTSSSSHTRSRRVQAGPSLTVSACVCALSLLPLIPARTRTR